GGNDVTETNSECGIRNAECTLDLRFRIPHSAFRILLVGALAACGRSDGPRVTVTIPPGSTLDAAVDSLAANHVIAHPGTFRLYARLRGLAGSLKSGVRSEEHTSELQSRGHL